MLLLRSILFFALGISVLTIPIYQTKPPAGGKPSLSQRLKQKVHQTVAKFSGRQTAGPAVLLPESAKKDRENGLWHAKPPGDNRFFYILIVHEELVEVWPEAPNKYKTITPPNLRWTRVENPGTLKGDKLPPAMSATRPPPKEFLTDQLFLYDARNHCPFQNTIRTTLSILGEPEWKMWCLKTTDTELLKHMP